MRLFIGVELPDAVKKMAADQLDAVRQRVGRAAPSASIRWVEPANLHITLWFIGEVDDTRAAAVRSALEPAFATRRFDLRLEGLGAFPPGGPPRVIWIGVRSGGEPLAALHAELGGRLARLGYEPEARAFSPHLTVARVKEIGGGEAKAVRAVLADHRVALDACAQPAVTLFRSRTSPKGARYESLLRVPLR
jgi:RNA 2',3'-cyclic 3'-phosphodiesterase